MDALRDPYYDPVIDQGVLSMQAVTVSPKFQVVIPLVVREAMGLVPGQKLQVLYFDNRIELIPVRPAKELRGLLRGIPNDFEREPDRQ